MMIDKQTTLRACKSDWKENVSTDLNQRGEPDDILHYLILTPVEVEGGKRPEKITVLDRTTGYIGEPRDVETGYTDEDGNFWLVNGDFDIRRWPDLTIVEAIEKIKEHAVLGNRGLE